MIEKYLVCKKDELINPFMHIKQKQNGELCFRFLNVTDKRFDFHYTRHNDEVHTRVFYKGMNPRKAKTSIEKRNPVFLIKSLERIRALIITEHTCMMKPTEKIKQIPTIMTIDSSRYDKGLVNMMIYLNPSIPLDEVIKITNPEQYIQDKDFNPPLLILCFKHSKSFLKLGVDMI